MTARVFVDTNVLVYRYDLSQPAKHRSATDWLERLWETRLGRVSTQVQHELYATLSRKLGMPRDDARTIVTSLEAWQPVDVGHPVVTRAWALEDRHSLSWWDALIVAAAQICGADALLTEDLQHGAEYGGVRVVDPFLVPPQAGRGVHQPNPPPYP